MKVSLFPSCLVDQLRPEVGLAAVRVLRHLGCEVEFPQSQICCGQPAFNSGYTDEARSIGRTLLRALGGAEHVVALSGSCAGMIHHGYAELFQAGPEQRDAADLGRRMREFSQFLVNVLGVSDIGARFAHRVTYHPSCHASRLLGLGEEPLTLLSAVEDIDLIPLPGADDCCGFGGSFCVKLSALSAAIGDEKLENIRSTGAEYVVSSDVGCLTHLEGRSREAGPPVTVLHLAELLDRGLASARDKTAPSAAIEAQGVP